MKSNCHQPNIIITDVMPLDIRCHHLVIAVGDMHCEHSEGGPPALGGRGLVTGLDVDKVGLSLLKVKLLHNCHEAL